MGGILISRTIGACVRDPQLSYISSINNRVLFLSLFGLIFSKLFLKSNDHMLQNYLLYCNITEIYYEMHNSNL